MTKPSTFRFLRRLSLRSVSVRGRITLLSAVTIGGLLAIAAVYWTGQNAVHTAFARSKAFAGLSETVRDIRALTLTMRVLEKEFVLHPQEAHITRFDETRVDLNGKMTLLLAMASGPDSEAERAGLDFRPQVKELQKTLSAIETYTAQMFEQQRRMGLGEGTGLLGQLAAAAGTIERRLQHELRTASNSEVEKVARLVSEMQRAERDMMLYGLDVNVGKFEVAFGRAERMLKKAYLPNAVRKELMDALAAYRAAIDGWTAAYGERLAAGEKVANTFDVLAPPGRQS